LSVRKYILRIWFRTIFLLVAGGGTMMHRAACLGDSHLSIVPLTGWLTLTGDISLTVCVGLSMRKYILRIWFPPLCCWAVCLGDNYLSNVPLLVTGWPKLTPSICVSLSVRKSILMIWFPILFLLVLLVAAVLCCLWKPGLAGDNHLRSVPLR